VVRNWERLVGAAVTADFETGGGGAESDWSDSEQGDEEDGLERMPRRSTATKRSSERSKSYVVPQWLAAQTDIDAVMEAAEAIQKENTEVARICM